MYCIRASKKIYANCKTIENYLFVKMNTVQNHSHLDHLFQAFVTSSLCEKEPNLHWKCHASSSAEYNAEAQDGLQAMHEA